MAIKVAEEFRKIPYMNEEEIQRSGLNLDVFNPSFNPISVIDLNYKPIICKPPEEADADGYHVEEDGIGGSDAGAFMGLNERRSPRLAAKQKLGILPRTEPDAELQYIFDFGHVMEEPIIALYAAKSGNHCWRDRAQYQHPFYPWMKADMDGFVEFPDGSLAILECKTFSTRESVASKWHSGVFGEGGTLGHPEYIAQAYHDMAVCNIDKTIFLANSCNDPNNLVVVTVNRDLEKEIELINTEGKIWCDLMEYQLPEENLMNEDVYAAVVAGYAKAKAEKSAKVKPSIELPTNIVPVLDKITKLKEDKKALMDEVEDIQEGINALQEMVIGSLGEAEQGSVADYDVSFKGLQRTAVDTKKLELSYPEVYKKCTSTYKTTPSLRIKKIK